MKKQDKPKRKPAKKKKKAKKPEIDGFLKYQMDKARFGIGAEYELGRPGNRVSLLG